MKKTILEKMKPAMLGLAGTVLCMFTQHAAAKDERLMQVQICVTAADIAFKAAQARDQGVSKAELIRGVETSRSIKRDVERLLAKSAINSAYVNGDATPLAIKDAMLNNCIAAVTGNRG